MSSATDAPLPVGYVSGDIIANKYRLKRVIGEGGMGSVWTAENMDLAADVALKLIRADVAEPGANERFLGEARLAARLKHPAIVSVFDFGKTENEEPYIVMELLQGETLGQVLARQGTIEPAELLQTLLPIIDALHLAHGHNVVHRDLKPDNIFVAKGESGEIQPKLLDFGIAKLRGTSAFKATKLTQAGTLIGSPDYMSPEQARGEADLDARSDVWALCVLSYECLVGKPPFHGDNYNALLWAIIHDEPVPSTVFQAGDSELWRLLKRGFAKDRADRWNDAKQLGEAFAHWLESNGIGEDICHRSLHASWLPTERPTRPEMVAPFFPLASTAPPPPNDAAAAAASTAPPSGPPLAPIYGEALPPTSIVPPPTASMPSAASSAVPSGLDHPEPGEFRAASSSHSALTTPTRAMVWRPHTRSLWFAGIGVLTLIMAVVLSDDGLQEPLLQQPLTPQQVKPLQVAGSRFVTPGAIPRALEPNSRGPSQFDKLGDPPIGQAPELEEPSADTSDARLRESDGPKTRPRVRRNKSRRKRKEKTLRVRDLREIPTVAPEEPKPTASPKKAKPSRSQSKKTRRRRKKAPVSKPKKPSDEPFDFGI